MKAVRFTFDDGNNPPVFDGFTDGTTWNGWPNVWVTPDTRTRLVDCFRREGDDQSADELAAAYVISDMSPPLVSLANGYTPTLIEGDQVSQDPAAGGPVGPELGEISPPRWSFRDDGAICDASRGIPLQAFLRPPKGGTWTATRALGRKIVAALNAQEG